MNNRLSLRRVWLAFRISQESKQVCQLCNTVIPSSEFMCEAEACQMQALEAQAMLAPFPLKQLAAKRRMPRRAAALTVKPVFSGAPVLRHLPA